MAATGRTLRAGSGNSPSERTSKALASALGVEPSMFPGGHLGFAEEPERFAMRVREVLRES